MNAVHAAILPRQLNRFAEPSPREASRGILHPLLTAATVCVAVGLALTLAEVPPLMETPGGTAHRVTVEFDAVELPRPQPELESAPPPEPPRLDPATVLAQTVDRPAPEAVVAKVAPTQPASPADPEPRRVYGVRKVYARGLGAAGAGAGRLVVKRGNTVDGRPDSLTATAADLRGELAALSAVERAPEPLHRVKPVYSEALAKARARGVVSAYLLVDVDGAVRDVNITEDIGYDSREVASAAFRRFRFRPAVRGGEPVAVWILHRIRFEFQE
ncbi:MAG: hypothetical protein GY838_03190 [bacterium]|nr:hypothetical protein [bacterium]